MATLGHQHIAWLSSPQHLCFPGQEISNPCRKEVRHTRDQDGETKALRARLCLFTEVARKVSATGCLICRQAGKPSYALTMLLSHSWVGMYSEGGIGRKRNLCVLTGAGEKAAVALVLGLTLAISFACPLPTL